MAKEYTIDEYQELLDFQEELNAHKDKWIFRGEQHYLDPAKELKTSLEKTFAGIWVSLNTTELAEHKRNAEKDIIREFQRKLHLYTSNLPTRADILQWLSIMQHHGAPTRMLDWTYSFWIAVHFATSWRGINEEAAIWAVNSSEIMAKSSGLLSLPEFKNYANGFSKEEARYCDPDALQDNVVVHYLIKNPFQMIYYSNPFRLNERLTLQQGAFLIPGDITKSFQDNLYYRWGLDDDNFSRKAIIKISNSIKEKIVFELRKMNINNAVLFPGLDGFSQSLWTRACLPMKDKLSLESKDLTLFP